MSFLWCQEKWNRKKQLEERPSPMHCRKLYFYYATKKYKYTIERIFVLIFRNHRKRQKISAGMTVEAAIVLPLFFFFFLNIISAVEMIRLHGNLQMALWNAGNKMSIYGTALLDTDGDVSGENNDNIWQKLGDLAFSYGYIKGEIVRELGRDYLEEAPLKYGAKGLQFPESEILTSDDTFEILVTYLVEPWLPLKKLLAFRMANHYYGHLWNGYGGENGTDEQLQTVYVAENASVYHIRRSCTHLSLTIRTTDWEHVEYERNAYGQKYTPCEICAKNAVVSVLFVGLEGDRYHFRRNCPGLKRTVYSMSLMEAAELYRPCSRCSMGKGETEE